MLVRNSALLLEKIDQLNWLNQLKYFIDFIHLIDLIVALRTPAMPFGLEAFVAVKLRSLCWQHRLAQGWYGRKAEGPEQQR